MAKKKKPDEPPPWWREPPYTTLPNSYLLKLAQSDLTGNEFRGLISIWVHTIGASGAKWNSYGRESDEVSAATVAEDTGMDKRNAQGIVRRLLAKGAALKLAAGKGRRGNTLSPAPKPRGKAAPEPAPEVVDDSPADPTVMRDYLARRKAEGKAAAMAYAKGSGT